MTFTDANLLSNLLVDGHTGAGLLGHVLTGGLGYGVAVLLRYVMAVCLGN